MYISCSKIKHTKTSVYTSRSSGGDGYVRLMKSVNEKNCIDLGRIKLLTYLIGYIFNIFLYLIILLRILSILYADNLNDFNYNIFHQTADCVDKQIKNYYVNKTALYVIYVCKSERSSD